MEEDPPLLEESGHPDAAGDETAPEDGPIHSGMPLEDIEVDRHEFLSVTGVAVVVEEGVGDLVRHDPDPARPTGQGDRVPGATVAGAAPTPPILYRGREGVHPVEMAVARIHIDTPDQRLGLGKRQVGRKVVIRKERPLGVIDPLALVIARPLHPCPQIG